jgi:hypothetical protein
MTHLRRMTDAGSDAAIDLAEVEEVMSALAERRPVFHTEADFQHAFAWELQRRHPEARIRLETRPRPGVRLDVLAITDGRRVAIELKCLLRDLTTTIDGELFALPNQSAQDVRRYDFVKDVARLEVLRREAYADVGFSIALTNDASYWQGGNREGVADAAFRLGEGRTLTGALAWAAHTGAGTMRGRETPIELIGAYELVWRDYSSVDASRNGRFRYLVVVVE